MKVVSADKIVAEAAVRHTAVMVAVHRDLEAERTVGVVGGRTLVEEVARSLEGVGRKVAVEDSRVVVVGIAQEVVDDIAGKDIGQEEDIGLVEAAGHSRRLEAVEVLLRHSKQV